MMVFTVIPLCFVVISLVIMFKWLKTKKMLYLCSINNQVYIDIFHSSALLCLCLASLLIV